MSDHLFDFVESFAAMSNRNQIKSLPPRLLGKKDREPSVTRDKAELFHA